jgi:MFS family permease
MSPPPARTAWLVVALLVPVALLNYLDRQMMATMKDSVMHDIPTIETDVNWGFMLGQFKWVYAFLSPVGGLIADRLSRRFTITGSLFVWSAVTWWTGQVTTFQELLWARSLMGISEAFYIPAALALITDYHTGGTRSRAVGLHQMGIYLGVMAGAFGGFVADAPPPFGWRFAFTACGVAGMVYALPVVLLLRDPPRTVAVTRGVAVVFRDLFQLLTNVSFLLLVLYFTLPAIAGWVVRDWMPAVLKKEFDLTQRMAGIAAVLSWQVPAVWAAILSGWLADRWVRRTPRGRIYASAIGTGLMVPAIAGVGLAPNVWVAVAFLALFGIGWGFFDGNNMPILSQLVKPNLRATGYGLMNLVSISIGGLADVGFGALSQNQVPIGVTFTAMAGLAVVSVVLVLLIRPRPTEG